MRAFSTTRTNSTTLQMRAEVMVHDYDGREGMKESGRFFWHRRLRSDRAAIESCWNAIIGHRHRLSSRAPVSRALVGDRPQDPADLVAHLAPARVAPTKPGCVNHQRRTNMRFAHPLLLYKVHVHTTMWGAASKNPMGIMYSRCCSTACSGRKAFKRGMKRIPSS